MKINPALISELHKQMAKQDAECARINKLRRIRERQIRTPEVDAIRAAVKGLRA